LLGLEHGECKNAAKAIRDLVKRTALGDTDIGGFAAAYDGARNANGHRVVEPKPALEGWTDAVERVLDDRILSSEEEHRLMTLASAIGIDENNAGDAWVSLAKAAILRDVKSLPTTFERIA